MKRIHYAIKRLALAGLLTAIAAHAEWNFETDFNDDYPDGTEVYGTTVVEWIDDDAEDGVLQLTLAEGNQNGSWIVDDFSEGQTIGEFEAGFRMLMGGNTSVDPADGMSFSFGRNIPDNTFSPAENDAHAVRRLDPGVPSQQPPEAGLKLAHGLSFAAVVNDPATGLGAPGPG